MGGGPLPELLGDVRRYGRNLGCWCRRRGLCSCGRNLFGWREWCFVVELGYPLFQQRLVLFQALDFLVDLELGGDAVVDFGEGALFLPQRLASAVCLVAARRVGEQEAHAKRHAVGFVAAA